MNHLLPCDGCGLKPEIVHNAEFTKATAAECACGRRTAWHMDEIAMRGEWNYRFGRHEETNSPKKIEV
jgi:hypothetical protein